MGERKFAPVQAEPRMNIPAGEVPWAVHKMAWNEYHRHHKGQSAEELADRAGFSWSELVACLRGDYSHKGCTEARALLEGE